MNIVVDKEEIFQGTLEERDDVRREGWCKRLRTSNEGQLVRRGQSADDVELKRKSTAPPVKEKLDDEDAYLPIDVSTRPPSPNLKNSPEMIRPIDEYAVMEGERNHAGSDIPHPAGSDRSGCSDGFKPSVKLRARIEKLAHWRVYPFSIEIWKGAFESQGGHATISKGRMDLFREDMRDLEKRALGKNLDREAIDDFLRERQKMKGRTQAIDVAVKKMRVADDTDFERVLGLAIREAEFLAGLAHRNIAELEGFVEDVSESTIWLVFPWSNGGNLRDFIVSKDWEMPEKISLINDVAQGLAYLHSRTLPICHGDLKSLNVLVYMEDDGEVFKAKVYARITDFGSARRLAQQDPTINTQAESQAPQVHSPSVKLNTATKTITLTGNKYTLRWAAPELLLEDQLSLWSDIWALGWIAYEVMTESLPFEDVTSDIGIVERVVEGKLPSLADNANLALIQELCSLMQMCWKMEPTERPTAESCRRAINGMPMIAPETLYGIRSTKSERLCEMGKIYQSRGEYRKAFNLFIEAVHVKPTAVTLCSISSNLAQLARLQRNYSETIALYNEVWSRSRDDKDLNGLANALCDVAELHRLRNKHNKDIEHHSDHREIEMEKWIAKALCSLSDTHRRRGEYEKAISLYPEALEIQTDLGNRAGQAGALWGLADVHRLRGEYEKAIPLYSKSLEINSDLGNSACQANALWGLADVHRLRGEYEKAIPLYSKSLEIRTDLGNSAGQASALRRLAFAHHFRGEYEKAIPLYSKSLEIQTDLGNRAGQADALWGLADVHQLRGDYEKVIPPYFKAFEIKTELRNRAGQADALWDLADAYRLRGEPDKAIPLYFDAMEICTELDDSIGQADAMLAIADVHRLRGKYHEALEISTNIGDGLGMVDALFGLANVYRDQNRPGNALFLYKRAAELAENFGNMVDKADALRDAANARQLLQLQESLSNSWRHYRLSGTENFYYML